jgi:transcriptional regulator with XRE-family HTH domain
MEPPGFTIRRLRNDRGWTLSDLAQRTELSIAYLSSMETRNRPLTRAAAEKLATAFADEPNEREKLLDDFDQLIAKYEERKKERAEENKWVTTQTTLRAFDRDIFDGIRILRGGRIEKKAYALVEQEGFEIVENGRTLSRRSIIEVDGELFEVEFSLSRLEKDLLADQFKY